ncbi:unnamed protein product, partial [Scytosiphon promiscuus]
MKYFLPRLHILFGHLQGHYSYRKCSSALLDQTEEACPLPLRIQNLDGYVAHHISLSDMHVMLAHHRDRYCSTTDHFLERHCPNSSPPLSYLLPQRRKWQQKAELGD